MTYFFKPSDVRTKTCSVVNITRGGAAFAICENEEAVFISPAITSDLAINVGDLLTAYCIDNHAPERDNGYQPSARWRAIRVTVQERLVSLTASPPEAAKPAPKPEPTPEEVAERCRKLFDLDRAWTTRQLADAVGIDHSRVCSHMNAEHDAGRLALCRIYASGTQERASAVYFAKSTAILTELIDEIELGA